MTFCCLSDTHGRHHQLDMSLYPADCLLFAGDWTKGRDLDLTETKDFLAWLGKLDYKHKVIVAGNHERQVEASPEALQALLTSYPTITYLNNSSCRVGSYNVFGSPYSNEFCNWAFMEEEFQLNEIWQQIPDDTNILITHGPAYCCHDMVKRSQGKDPHVGSQSLQNSKLELSDLKLHVSAHIHEAYGKTKINNVINVCASILNENYSLVNSPIVIKL